jgi:hypothetical protein
MAYRPPKPAFGQCGSFATNGRTESDGANLLDLRIGAQRVEGLLDDGLGDSLAVLRDPGRDVQADLGRIGRLVGDRLGLSLAGQGAQGLEDVGGHGVLCLAPSNLRERDEGGLTPLKMSGMIT